MRTFFVQVLPFAGHELVRPWGLLTLAKIRYEKNGIERNYAYCNTSRQRNHCPCLTVRIALWPPGPSNFRSPSRTGCHVSRLRSFSDFRFFFLTFQAVRIARSSCPIVVHPHCHFLVTDGCFQRDRENEFTRAPAFDWNNLKELFRRWCERP